MNYTMVSITPLTLINKAKSVFLLINNIRNLWNFLLIIILLIFENMLNL